jgi:crotonobetaine/carnitine-CoA ligase
MDATHPGLEPLPDHPAELAVLPALRRQAAETPDRVAVTGTQGPVTYAELVARTARRAAAFRALGVRAGGRVALLCDSHVGLLEDVLATWWLGAVCVPVNAAARGEQLRHALVHSDPQLLVVDARLAGALAGAGDPPAGTSTVVVRDQADLPGRWAQLRSPVADGVADGAAPPEYAPQDGTATAAILYTSGTTGPSKGACCSHAQLLRLAHRTGLHLGVRRQERLLTCLPLFHVNALTAFMTAVLAAGTFVLVERFSASRFWSEATAHRADVTYLLGAMVGILASRPPGLDDRSHALRVALAPATPAHLHAPFRERFGVQLVEGYASTESNLAIGVPADAQRPGLMGTVVAGFEARVADEHDRPVPDGVPGELLLRSDHPAAFAAGYWRQPDETVRAWRNLWFHTGDRVVRHPDGWFEFLDRLSDSIRRRGENISSFEVERVLLAAPGVRAAAAYAVPSELGEDEVMAALVVEDPDRFDVTELMRHCEGHLAYFAVPRFVDLVDELPLTANGKVQKFVLRRRGVTDTTWDREAAGYVLRRDP